MKNNLLYAQGPGLLCFELLEKIYGHNEEEEFTWSGSKQEKTNLVLLADRLCKQSILLESSKLCLTKASIAMMTKNNNSQGKRNSIWIQWAFNRKQTVRSCLCQLFRKVHTYCLLYRIIYNYMMKTSDDSYGKQKSIWEIEPNKIIRSSSTRFITTLLCWIIKGHIMKANDSYWKWDSVWVSLEFNSMKQFNFWSNYLNCEYVLLSTMKDLPTNTEVSMGCKTYLFVG